MKRPAITWAEAASEIETALSGAARHEIVDALAASADPLGGLRAAMRRNAFVSTWGTLDLQRVVASFDARCRQESLHLTQAWDFARHRFTDDSTPVLLLDYALRLPSRKLSDRETAALLLDQYFVTVLSLLAVRAWDDGDANANLDRVTHLLGLLHGPEGSGHAFVDDAESLLFLAISYFHPEEVAYDTLLAKVEQLDARHQLGVATACAGMMSAHLRWGLRFMYQRDIGRMRDDNAADYPWLSHAVATLAREYEKLSAFGSRLSATTEALMLGLAADPWAFTGEAPAVLKGRAHDHALVREVLAGHRDNLLADFEAMRPSPASYSPLSFTCNFPTNAAVAAVTVSVEDGTTYPPLSALLSSRGDAAAAQAFAARLMDYSVSDPSRLGAGKAPLIAYDPFDAASALNALLRCLREGAPR